MVKINWTQLSITDMESIRHFIGRDSQKYAIITIQKLYQSTQDLIVFPRKGRIVPEIGDDNIRELIIGNYRLIYRIIDEGLINILRVQSSYKLFNKDSLE
jgi:toxin ParE1/3/4